MAVKKDLLDEYGMTPEQVAEAEAKIDTDIILEEQRRIEVAKRAPLLTKKFVEGKSYREQEIVKTKDNDYLKVFVIPLTEDDIYESFDNIGVEELPSASKGIKLSQIKYARLAVELAEKAIVLPKDVTMDQIKNVVAYGELTRIGSNILAKMFNRETVETEKPTEASATAGFT